MNSWYLKLKRSIRPYRIGFCDNIFFQMLFVMCSPNDFSEHGIHFQSRESHFDSSSYTRQTGISRLCRPYCAASRKENSRAMKEKKIV